MKIYEGRIAYKLINDGEATQLNKPGRIVSYMNGAFDENPRIEWFYVILLNQKNNPLGRVMVTKGIASSTLVHPRETFEPAIIGGATGIILVHNHPSGNPTPSQADIKVTKQLNEAAKILEIKLLDHIIIGDKDEDPKGYGFYSFSNSGLI